jgi:hypothetical protein
MKVFAIPHYRERITTQPVHVWFDYSQRYRGSNRGINRVAAGFQDSKTCLGSKWL